MRLRPRFGPALLLAAGAASASFAAPAQDSSWLQKRLETGLSEALGGKVSIGRLDVEWTSLAATVGDVSIELPVEGAAPLTATIARGRIKLAWSGLAGIGGGSIHVTDVQAEGATFSCSREWVDRWKPRVKRSGRTVDVRIDHVAIRGGVVDYSDGGQRLRVHVEDVVADGDWSTYRRLVIGRATGRATIDAPLFKTPWPVTARGGVRVGPGRVEIFGATGEGPGGTAEVTAGTVTWGAGTSFTAEGNAAIDLAAIAPYLKTSTRLSGAVAGPFQVVLAGGPIRVVLPDAATRNLAIGPVTTESGRGSLTVRPGRLDVAGLDAAAYGGRFTGGVSLTFGKDMVLATDLVGERADLAALVGLTGKALPIASEAAVTFKITGDPARVSTWTGEGTFDAVPKPAARGRFPARGRGRIVFADGRVRVESERVEMASAILALHLSSDLPPRPPQTALSLGGTTKDAAATQAAALVFLDALGVPRNRFATEPIAGRGAVRATLSTAKTTKFDLALDLTEGSWAGEPFTSARLDLGVDDGAVSLRDVLVARGEESLLGRARFTSGTGALAGIDIQTRGVALRPILARLGYELPVDGRLDLELRGDELEGRLVAQGHATLHAGVVGKETLERVDADVRVEGDLVVLANVTARGEAIDASGEVLYDRGRGGAEIRIEPAVVQLGALRSLAEAGLSASGALEARGTVLVDREGPRGFLTIGASEVVVGQGVGLRRLPLGDLSGTAALGAEGVEIAVRSLPNADWTFEAFLGWDETLPISSVLYFDDLVVGGGADAALGESVDLRLRGQVAVEGALADPEQLQVNGAFDDLAARVGSRSLRAMEPFPVRLESGQFAAGPSRFSGDGATLEIEARGALSEGAISGRIKGDVDLGIASSFWSELRGSGPISVDVTLAGTLDHPDLQGTATLIGGKLRIVGYRQTLDQIDARATLSGNRLTLASLHAFQGGGEISGSGWLTLDGFSPSAWRADLRGANVAATFPSGFKGVYEGTLAVDGTPKATTISGDLRVVSGLYARDFDLGGFGTAQRDFGDHTESPFPRNLFLDIDVVAPGNVWLRNDIAKLEASGELHVGGELARPELTGRLALFPGGTVRFRDVDYRLEYGALDLTDPKRLNPYLDVRGRTRVAEYEVSLHVEGTLDKFTYDLTSTPPLSSQDIISLLVTGRTLDSLSDSGSASALPGDMAAYYFAGLLSQTFGKQVQQSLGIDQLAITPILLKGEADPTARVTVGKRVGPDLKIVFSQDIGSAQKQTYQVVWDATRRVRFIAESDSESGLGGEVQYARQFGGSKPTMARDRPGGGTDPPGVVATMRVVEEDGTERADLAKKLKLRPGDAFERGRVLAEADRLRERLLKHGLIQAVVRPDVTRDEATGGYDVVFRVDPGPKVEIEIVSANGKGERAARRALKHYWRETPYTFDYWDEATRSLIEELQEDGYYAADAVWDARETAKGLTVRFRLDRGTPVHLRALRVHGVQGLPQEAVEKQITSLQSRRLGKRRLRPKQLADDLAAVRAFYRDEGYARVRIGVPRVALATTADSAEVDVDIEEGARFTVREIAFDGSSPVADDVLTGWIELREGGIFSPRALAASEQTIRDNLDARGYPDAKVDSGVELASDTVKVRFVVETEARKRVAAIDLEGNRTTRDRTISRALTFGVGDPLSRQTMVASQQRLYRTGLFSNVRFSYAPLDASDPAHQRVTLRVEEAPPTTVSLGVGYDSEDGPRASFLYGYSNLGGRGIGLALQGLYSGSDKRAQLTLRRRQLFGGATDALASALFEDLQHDSFTETRSALSFRWERRPRPRWIRYFRYSIQNVRISDVSDLQDTIEEILDDKISDVRLGDLGVGLVRDSRDDAFSATRGTYGSFEGSVFGKYLGSERDFVKVFFRGSVVLPMPRGLRFASFLRIGLAEPYGSTVTVPISERFFAGGSNTLRGFETDTVGGVVIQGDHFGGEALVLFNEELHFPIWKSVKGELFVDAGNVYPTIQGIDWGRLGFRFGGGLGIRIDTPIGPIRAEYGWKLDRKEGETPGEFVFAIGAVF